VGGWVGLQKLITDLVRFYPYKGEAVKTKKENLRCLLLRRERDLIFYMYMKFLHGKSVKKALIYTTYQGCRGGGGDRGRKCVRMVEFSTSVEYLGTLGLRYP
jgi:hypothetical protein